MSALPSTTTNKQWAADIWDFATRNKVDAYLDPLLESTRRVFPTAQNIRVFLEDDPEIRDDWHIVFDVRVSQVDVPNFVEAQHRWIDELYLICPAPLVCTFRLGLTRVRS